MVGRRWAWVCSIAQVGRKSRGKCGGRRRHEREFNGPDEGPKFLKKEYPIQNYGKIWDDAGMWYGVPPSGGGPRDSTPTLKMVNTLRTANVLPAEAGTPNPLTSLV